MRNTYKIRWMGASRKARELGAINTFEGSNWVWSKNFPSKDSAVEFVKWLDRNEYKNSGVRGLVPGGTLSMIHVRWQY